MTLDEQYQKVIDDQRAYLLSLQEDFNKECEEAKSRSQEKLHDIPESDKEAREAVLQNQKKELDAALKKLKLAVDESTRGTMRKLEDIIRQKEVKILEDLEQQIANL